MYRIVVGSPKSGPPVTTTSPPLGSWELAIRAAIVVDQVVAHIRAITLTLTAAPGPGESGNAGPGWDKL